MAGPRATLRWLLAFALVASACSGAASGDSSTSIETSPPPSTTTTTAPVATVTTAPGPCLDGPFCVTYEIPPGATWSDGEPISAADYVHTLDLITDPVHGAGDQTGYQLITDIQAIGERGVLVTFSAVFPPWRNLFPFLLPAHEDVPYSEEGAPVNGPFLLEQWIAGERIVLRRNPAYWADVDPVSGAPLGDVQELVFVFPKNVRDQLRGLERGEIDVINPRPLDWMIEDLTDMGETASFEVVPGEFWEHIDFNHDDPLLEQAWVREALTLAIDREAILDETVRLVDPDARPLDSTVYLANSVDYQDNFDQVYDPVAAESLLTDRFCEKGDDGIYSCQGRRMSFTWATTVGDEYREAIFEIVAASLEEVGIELTLQQRTPSELFSTGVFFGGPNVWQLINFSWRGDVDPYLANTTYYCRGDAPSGFGALNVNRYCDETVESLIKSTETLVDPDERVAYYNQADTLYLANRAIVPLFQKPELLAHTSALNGPRPNISRSTDLWNVAAWRGMESVVVALDGEPDDLDPVHITSESERAVLSAMLQGAFGINPSLEFVPVLSGSAEAVMGATGR